MSQQKHTPTPWHKSAKCQSCGSTTIAYEINEDKIRAVNSHEELLEAAKLMKRILKENRNFTLEEFKQVGKAIAKAESYEQAAKTISNAEKK